MTLLVNAQNDIASGSISENVLALTLDRENSGKSGIKDLSLRELVFNVAFEFEGSRSVVGVRAREISD